MLRRLKSLMMGALPKSLAGRLHAWRVRRSVSRYTPRIVENVYGTSSLRVWISDPLAESWYGTGSPELPEVLALKRGRLRPGARVFDLGAHQGVVAAMLAREVGSSGELVAVEPNLHNVEAIYKNRELNDLRQMHVVRAAVSKSSGKVCFSADLNGGIDDGTGRAGRIEVDAVTIDELAARFGFPDVVFLDVEGAECLALAGATQVLAKSADWFIEVHVNHGLQSLGGSIDQILSCFPPDRFRVLARSDGHPDFLPFAENPGVALDRFFLIALSKAAPVTSSP